MAQNMTNGQACWLEPSDALNRFEPPEELGIKAGLSENWRAHFGFRVGNIRLLIQPESVSEVIELGSIYAIPNTPPWLLGLMNLRGNLVPVFNLHHLLEISDDAHKKQMVLVLDKGDDAVAMLIDGLPEALGTNTRKLQHLPPVPTVLKNHTHEAYSKDGTVWLEFEHRGLFKSLVEQCVV